jgi:predicted dehydrogenase
VGLLGCGRIAQRFHLPILRRIAGAELVSVAEAHPQRRGSCRALVGDASRFPSHEDLLEAGGIDAVVICLPPALHAQAAIASFQRGLHVYLEKPLALTPEDGRAVVAAWREAGTTGAIGFNYRLHPLVRRMRSALGNGEIGDPIGGQATFTSCGRALPEWKRKRQTGGGALLDLASHQFDLARYLLNREIIEVGASFSSFHSEEDTAVVEARLEDDLLMTFFISLAGVEEDRLELTGSAGKLVLDRYRSSRLRFIPCYRDFSRIARLRSALSVMAGVPNSVRDTVFPPRETSFQFALQNFIAAARGESSTIANLDDAIRSLFVVAAAEKSASEGIKVPVTTTL